MKIDTPLFNTLREISDWFGLPSHGLTGEDFMLQEIDQWNKNKLLKATNPYRANFFTIFIVYEGRAAHLYNDKTIRLESSSVFITAPGHYRNYVVDHLSQASFICFTEKFMAKYCFSDIYAEFPFLLSESCIYTTIDPENYLIIKNNIDQIKQEIQHNSNQKMLLIGNMTEFLLIKIKELFKNQLNPVCKKNNTSTIVDTFYKDLDNYFAKIVRGEKPRPLETKDFAALQSLNEDYFARIINAKTGGTPAVWINSRLLYEAKIMLTETSISIAEVADIFQFTTSRYFNIYFKIQTTMTPAQYKKSIKKS